jgi:EAL domain-containing protein (putative c-di-GMP-specific phosphodiesterase class I)
VAWSPNGSAHKPRSTLGSLLALGHDLGWKVAVGGVETPAQADALRTVACDLAQGFFYHGLLDWAQAAALLRQSVGKEAHWTTH